MHTYVFTAHCSIPHFHQDLFPVDICVTTCVCYTSNICIDWNYPHPNNHIYCPCHQTKWPAYIHVCRCSHTYTHARARAHAHTHSLTCTLLVESSDDHLRSLTTSPQSIWIWQFLTRFLILLFCLRQPCESWCIHTHKSTHTHAPKSTLTHTQFPKRIIPGWVGGVLMFHICTWIECIAWFCYCGR